MDAESRIIVAAELIQNAPDSAELPLMLDLVKANLQSLPEQTLADAGYRSEAVLKQLTELSTNVTMANGA